MSLLFPERFTDTIFIKDDSKLERDIAYLKSIRDRVVEKNKIDQDIKLMKIGLYGEKQISFELKNANIGMYVLHDVMLQYEDLTAQIDYVVITKAYTYFIECKNLIGNIKVDNKGEFVRTMQYGNKMLKEAIYSPYTQAQRHKEIYMKGWYQRNKGIKTLIFENGTRNNIKPLIVLANPKGILDIKYAPKEIKNRTVRVDQLVSYIKKDIDGYDKTLFSSKKEMENIANRFLGYHVEKDNNFEGKYTFVDVANSLPENNINDIQLEGSNNTSLGVAFSNNDNFDVAFNSLPNETDKDAEVNNILVQKLKEFRKKKSSATNIPAFFIFTDQELDDILNANIKTLDQLKESKILSEVKVRLHGQEIIDIINSESK